MAAKRTCSQCGARCRLDNVCWDPNAGVWRHRALNDDDQVCWGVVYQGRKKLNWIDKKAPTGWPAR